MSKAARAGGRSQRAAPAVIALPTNQLEEADAGDGGQVDGQSAEEGEERAGDEEEAPYDADGTEADEVGIV